MARSISLKEYKKRAENLVRKIHQDVSPFEDNSPAASARRRKKAENDLLYFCETYLPHHFDDPFEQGHGEMAEATQVWEKIIQVRGFRGLGKTTAIANGYALQAVIFKKTRFLPIISDTEGQSELFMLPVRVELAENPRIKADFGELKGSVEWAEDAFVTSKGVKVEAFSWRNFKRGRKYLQHRARIAICDDLENLESVKNKRNTDKREDALLGDMFNALDLKKPWQLWVLTNKLGRNDLDARLRDNKAVHTVNIPAEKKNGRATHPKSFPKKVLNKIKETIGHVRYAREYLLQIISSEDDDFQEDWFVWLKSPEPQYKYMVMVNDPSVGNTEGHDTKALLVLGLTMDERHIDVMHAWIRRTTINSMCKSSFEINRAQRPHKFVIESNGFQVLVKDKLQGMAKHQEAGFDLLSKIKQIKNNSPKNTRIMRMQAGVENGTYRFVRGSDMQRLVNQYLDFDSSQTDNEDDGPDAMEMGVRELRKLNGDTGQANCEVI